MVSPADSPGGSGMDKRVQELEKWKPVASLQIERLEKEHQDTRLTRELFLKSVDTKFADFRSDLKEDLAEKSLESKEYGQKRDQRMRDLEMDVWAIQKKVWIATGMIITMQFLAPFVLKMLKVL
jgi:hypothetical protein